MSDLRSRQASDSIPGDPVADDDEEFGGHGSKHLSTNDLFIKDAFLVFRALCKLTMKPLNSERQV